MRQSAEFASRSPPRLSLTRSWFWPELVSADRDASGDGIARELLSRLPGSVAWLPEAHGLYEEERLAALLADLHS